MGTKRIIKKIRDPLKELKENLKKKESQFPLAMVEETLLRYFNEDEKKEKRQWLKLVADFFHHVHRCEGGSDAEDLDDFEQRINQLERREGSLKDI